MQNGQKSNHHQVEQKKVITIGHKEIETNLKKSAQAKKENEQPKSLHPKLKNKFNDTIDSINIPISNLKKMIFQSQFMN